MKPLPIWYQRLINKVIKLREQIYRSDIRWHNAYVTGYISGLFAANVITADEADQLYALVDNAAEHAIADMGD